MYDQSVCHRLGQPNGSKWLPNLMANAFLNVDRGGSTTFAVGVVTGGVLTYCSLGDSGIMVFRFDRALQKTYVAHKSPSRSYPLQNTDGTVVPCPYQAYLAHLREKTPEYAVNIMKEARTDKFEMDIGDVVLAATDGVLDNLGALQLEDLVHNAWYEGLSPEALTSRIVAESIASAGQPGGKPDDVTCVVAYVSHA